MKADRILQLSIVALLATFVFILYSSLHDTVVQAGESAPEFSVTTADGRTMTPHNFGGKLLLLNFWANWCPPCVEETPSLIALSQALGPKGLVVFGVSIDSSEPAYQRFLKRFAIPFPVYRDPDQKINLRYGTLQIPESYLIDTSGKVVEKIIGPENWSTEQMVQHIESLLQS